MAYRIKIVRGDTELEVEGDKKFVLDMFTKHGDLFASGLQEAETTKMVGSKTTAQIAKTSVGKKVSAGEFIRQLGFKKHTDIVLALGYYLEKVSGLASFTAADINACYYEPNDHSKRP